MRLAGIAVIGFLVIGSSVFVSAQISKEQEAASRYSNGSGEVVEANFFVRASNFFWQPRRLGYKHVWPVSSSFINMVAVCYLLFHVILDYRV